MTNGYIYKWFALKTQEGKELPLIAEIALHVHSCQLLHLIPDCKVVTEGITEYAEDKVIESKKLLFPGVVFVKAACTIGDEASDNYIIDKGALYIIEHARGFEGFTDGDNQPQAISDTAVYQLKLENKASETDLQNEDTVRILAGAYKGCKGTVASLDRKNGIATVITSALGKSFPLEVEFSQLEKI